MARGETTKATDMLMNGERSGPESGESTDAMSWLYEKAER